jgi:hypothetical protein
MRRLLVSLIAMAAILWAADRVMGAAMARLFHTSASLEDGDTMRRAWMARPDVVVCGSSRASHHYVADSLGSWLGRTTWNLGRDGSFGPLYQYGAAGIVLRHCSPRLWIMEVEPEILRGPELKARLAVFEPYLDDEPAARELVLLRSRLERLRLLSRTYRYNSLVLSLLSPKLGKHVHPRMGYLPLHGRLVPGPPPARAAAEAPVPVDPLKQEYLRRVIQLLRGRGCAVIATRSPVYQGWPAQREANAEGSRFLAGAFARLGVRYVDFSSPPLPAFDDPALFQDEAHLNDRGALLLTRALADTLRASGLPH